MGRVLLVLLSGVMNLNVARAQSLQRSLDGQGQVVFAGAGSALRHAQAGARIAWAELPDAPGFQVAGAAAQGNISGTVVDVNGTAVEGAQVSLSSAGVSSERKLATNEMGRFSFADVTPGRYKLWVSVQDFSSWSSKEIVLGAGESYDARQIKLRLSVATSSVDVVYSQYDLAQEQLKAQEKQRVLGIFPNFYVSYVWDAVPLTAGQKFQLALREQGDPEAFAGAAFAAGVEMGLGQYRGYGEGAKGFFTRMGAAYGDGFNSTVISGAILPSLLHQDPRYFYKGTGSRRARALYALSAVVICKGDNGHWQPNYSNVLGDFASGGISNAYYPAGDRGTTLTLVNTSIGLGVSAVGNVFQEFFIKKISTGVQP